jgi:CRISPR-associated protein Cas5h
MFAFKIWGSFASFRDPITISQNLSLPLPPKTTVGGMMASILGIENYFNDDEYFNFGYSCVTLSEIRKKSFSQNYIDKYTSRVGTKITAYESAIKKYRDVEKAKEKLLKLKREKEELMALTSPKKAQITKLEKRLKEIYKQLKMINKKCKILQDEIVKWEKKKNETFTKPKPTNRELILNPSYLIVIENFRYEEQIIKHLKNHSAIFPFYLGNSEFAGNFRYIESETISNKIDKVDSFTKNIGLIDFEFEQTYSNMTMPLRAIKERQYKEYQKVVFSDKSIKLKEPIKGLKLELSLDNQKVELGCEFI